MAAVVMHHFSVLAAPSVRSQGTVLGAVFNYSYICNTISTYHKEPAQSTVPQSKIKEEDAAAVSGTYKDDDSKYSLKNLLKRQETEAGHEE